MLRCLGVSGWGVGDEERGSGVGGGDARGEEGVWV